MKFIYLLINLTFFITLINGQSNLVPPSNFDATVNGNDVQLAWNSPDTVNNFFLSWDNGNIGNLIGLSAAGSYAVSARWDSTALADYSDYNISKIGLYIEGGISNFTSFIWQGQNADSAIFSQPVNQITQNDWTFIFPATPLSFDNMQDLWVGYEIDQTIPDFPVYTDDGPAVQGFGDMVNFDGDWISMSQYFGLDYNFKIRVYLTSDNGESIALNNSVLPSDFNFINSGQITSKTASIQVPEVKNQLSLTGYNLYRNNELITPTPLTDTVYLDPSLELGVYDYALTAVYDQGESNPVNTSVQIGNPEMVIFPEEITETVVIGESVEKILTIYNEGEVDLFWYATGLTEWAFLSPSSGIIAPGNGFDLQLFVYTFNFVAGEYSTDLVFYQNNPENPTITIPVNITAIGAPGISISPEALSFGDVPFGSSYISNLFIYNQGTENLVISDIVSSNPDYTFGAYEDTIPPNGQTTLAVTFEASELGESTGTLTIFSNDQLSPQVLVELSAYSYLQPPVFLQAEVDSNDVTLSWDMTTSGEGQWVSWDNGENFSGIGLSGGGTFQYAARWEPGQISEFNGNLIPKVSFFPLGDNSTFILKIWKGPNASIPLISQPVNSYLPDQWNEVFLSTPVTIDASQELWIGFEVTHPEGEYPAGVDSGPAVQGYGDMIYFDSTWISSFSLGLDFNWNMQFYALTGDSSFKVVNNSNVKFPQPKYFNLGIPELGDLQSSAAPVFSPENINFEVLGYNVYRNNILLNQELLEEMTYIDESVPFGVYQYGVTAVYDIGESPQNQINVQVGAPEISFDPEIILDSLESGETTEHLLTISNTGNFAMEWFAESQATWLTISQSSGIIEPGDSTQVTLQLFSAGLFSGNYQSNITFEINNLNNPVVSFPVEMNVTGNAQLVVSPDTLDFGVTAINTTKTAYITISNTGNDFIYITGMEASPDVFSTQSFPVFLYPGGVITLGIFFTPDSIGTFNGSFKVFAEDSTFSVVETVLTGSSILPQPVNLTAQVDSNNVILDWQSPMGNPDNVLQYSSDESATGIGYSDGGTFLTAAKFGPEELMIFNGTSLTELGFIPWTDNAEYTLKVWLGENAESLILSQPVDEVIPLQWNDYMLDISIPVDSSDYLWIGYEVTHEVGEFPAGCDFGPSIPGKSDLISTDGITWESLNYFGLPYSWNIRGNVDAGEKSSYITNLTSSQQPAFQNAGMIKSVVSPEHKPYKNSQQSIILLGYNVYRNGIALNDTSLITVSEYLDPNLETGIYSYEITAVYDFGESAPAGPVEVIIEEQVLSPEGWNHHQTGMTHVVHVPTAASKQTDFMSPGDWIGVFYDDNGELKCGGSVMWTESDSLKLIVYGDDPSTSVKEGFEPGEWMNWKVFMSETNEEHTINVEYNQMMPNYDGLFDMLGESALTSIQLTITGIYDEDEDEDKISLFPNPAREQFTVSGLDGMMDLSIISLTGEVVYMRKLSGDPSIMIEIDVSPGLYYVLLTGNEKRIQKKIILH